MFFVSVIHDSVGSAVNSIYFYEPTVLVIFYLSKCDIVFHMFMIQSKLFVT